MDTNKKLSSKIRQDYEEVKKEADRTLKKARIPLMERAARTIPYGLQMAIYAILIPFLTRTYTDWNIVWPGLAVVLGAILLRLFKDDYRLKARQWWAEKSLKIYEEVLDISKKYEEIEENFLNGENRLRSLDAALSTLSSVLKSNIIEKCEADIDPQNKNLLHIDMAKRASHFRNEFKQICKFICQILGGPNQKDFRCGLLVEDPKNSDNLIPIVVYNPEDEDYVSKTMYSKSTDFSGKLISQFQDNLTRKDWKKFAVYIIEDVKKVEQTEPHFEFRPIRLRKHQDYISCIVGNVIYCKNHKKEIIILGVINVDTHIPNAVTEEDYYSLQHYLHSAFRLLAERLLILKRCPDLVYPIWEK